MSKSQISENTVRASMSRKRMRELPTVNPSNTNEVLNPMYFLQKCGNFQPTTATMESNSKRRKLEMQPTPIQKDAQSEGVKLANGRKHSLELISLNDDVLLHIFRQLNWMDSVNLTAAYDCLLELKYLWTDKKRQEFILDDYMEMGDNLPKKLLSKIAPHIKTLGMKEPNARIMKSCKNVESLRIEFAISRLAAYKINAWIKESNMKGLWFKYCEDIDALLDGVHGLQELEIKYSHRNTEKFIENNTSLERLSIELDENFNFRVLQKLQSLQCLHIRTSAVELLSEFEEFVNVENLREFSFQCDTFDDEPLIINSLLKHLAEKSKVEKLQIVEYNVDGDTYEILKSFNLRALSLCCDDGPSQDFTNFIMAYPAIELKHLKLSWCTSQQLFILVQKWTHLESVCIYVGSDDEHKTIHDRALIEAMLKTSKTRSLLTLHMMTRRDSQLPMHIEVYIDFVQQQFQLIEREDEFCCSTTKSFSFSSRECFPY